MLVLRLLSAPRPEQHPVWFVLDELASLQKLPQLHTAITENRKSRNPIVLGFQGKAQLEVIYGHLAEVMLSQPATKIFLKTTEPNAAEWVSRAIGKVEIERMKETHFDGSRAGQKLLARPADRAAGSRLRDQRAGEPARLLEAWQLRCPLLVSGPGSSSHQSQSSSSGWRMISLCASHQQGSRPKIEPDSCSAANGIEARRSTACTHNAGDQTRD